MEHKPTVLPLKPADFEQIRCEYIQNQVTELITNYGKIDLIWYKGGGEEIPNKVVHKLQPGIAINRCNSSGGDYGDSEGALLQKRFQGWFETCETSWPSRKCAYTENAEVVSKNAPKPKKAFLLKTKKAVAFTYENGTFKLNIPEINVPTMWMW